jgi:hypothetical protein
MCFVVLAHPHWAVFVFYPNHWWRIFCASRLSWCQTKCRFCAMFHSYAGFDSFNRWEPLVCFALVSASFIRCRPGSPFQYCQHMGWLFATTANPNSQPMCVYSAILNAMKGIEARTLGKPNLMCSKSVAIVLSETDSNVLSNLQCRIEHLVILSNVWIIKYLTAGSTLLIKIQITIHHNFQEIATFIVK